MLDLEAIENLHNAAGLNGDWQTPASHIPALIAEVEITVEERDELKRENRRLQAEVERLRAKVEHKCELLDEN